MKNRLKELRTVLKISQKSMAERLGLPGPTISKYERGEIKPSADILAKIGLSFEVDLNWLLTGQGKIFVNKNLQLNNNALVELKQNFNLSDNDYEGLIELLESGASRDLILKFIQVKKGNKAALEELILNLQGVRAFI